MFRGTLDGFCSNKIMVRSSASNFLATSQADKASRFR